MLTDIDVLAVTQSSMLGHERIVFDCKSGSRESGIGRSFWLRGVMARLGASHGFVVVPEKVRIVQDHRISAYDLSVSLLHDSELETFARSIHGTTTSLGSLVGEVEVWERFLSIGSSYPSLGQYAFFAKSGFWMIKDPGERCRRSISRLRSIRAELDPGKAEHMAVFGDAVCLFLVALSELATRVLLMLLQPSSREEFASIMLTVLYGGYENLEAAQRFRRLASGASHDDDVSMFPELGRFEQLVREVMQAPLEALPAALLAREQSFEALMSAPSSRDFQRALVRRCRYAPKFVLLAGEYLQKAARLPPEFSANYRDLSMGLLSDSVATDAVIRETSAMAPELLVGPEGDGDN